MLREMRKLKYLFFSDMYPMEYTAAKAKVEAMSPKSKGIGARLQLMSPIFQHVFDACKHQRSTFQESIMAETENSTKITQTGTIFE